MRRLIAAIAIGLMFGSALAVPRPAFAQKKVSPDQVSNWGAFLWTCMKAKFPEISLSGDGRSAFDTDSGRNFAREGDTWIDVKTLQVVCPTKQSNDDWSGWGGFLWTCMKAKFPEISLSGDGRSAFDTDSGRNFARDGDTWIDTKTLEVVCPKLKPSTAQQPQTTPQTGSIPSHNLGPLERDLLAAHNMARAEYGAPPLAWSEELAAGAAAYAQQLADAGKLVHAPREGRGTERENVNQGMIGWNTNQMLDNWFREESNFVPGEFPNVSRTGDWYDVGHYSQVIWPTTTDFGCGMATGSGYQWLVCRYNPGGNKDGKYVGIPQPTDLANLPNETGIKQRPDMSDYELQLSPFLKGTKLEPVEQVTSGITADDDYWGASAGIIANLSEDTRLELGIGYEDYDIAGGSFGSGIYWDPISQVTIGAGASYVDIPPSNPPKSPQCVDEDYKDAIDAVKNYTSANMKGDRVGMDKAKADFAAAIDAQRKLAAGDATEAKILEIMIQTYTDITGEKPPAGVAPEVDTPTDVEQPGLPPKEVFNPADQPKCTLEIM